MYCVRGIFVCKDKPFLLYVQEKVQKYGKYYISPDNIAKICFLCPECPTFAPSKTLQQKQNITTRTERLVKGFAKTNKNK